MKNSVYILLCLCYFACKPEKVQTELKKENNTNSSTIESINKVVEEANYQLNSSRSDLLLAQMEEAYKSSEDKNTSHFISMNIERFKSGEYASAAQYMQNIFPDGGFKFEYLNKNTRLVYEIIADGYLMLGLEQNQKNIIFPIGQKQVQDKAEFTEAALAFYKMLIKAFPENKDYIWKLNFANMLLGSYPENIEHKYQILLNPLTKFPSPTKFNNLSDELNISHNNIGGGCALIDIDNDQDLDIYTSSHHLPDQLLIYKYDDYKYSTVQNSLGLKDMPGGSRVRVIDVNNDGYKDLFISRGASQGNPGEILNSLLIGSKEGFKDVAFETGIKDKSPTENTSWSDFDHDGDLDFYSNNGPSAVSYPGILYKNIGGISFNTVSTDEFKGETGVSSTFSDINGDGWQDLILLTSEGKPQVFLNNEGSLKRSNEHGLKGFKNGSSILSFDFENDGDFDILITGKGEARNSATDDFVRSFDKNRDRFTNLFLNDGNGKFTNLETMGGLEGVNYINAAALIDIDNDGYLDVYCSTGGVLNDDMIPNRLFLNEKGRGFKEVSAQSGTSCLQKTFSIAVGDMDKDGDSDLYVGGGGFYNGDKGNDFYFNNSYMGENHWVEIQLKGVRNNIDGIGSTIKIVGEDLKGNTVNVFREVHIGDGPFSTDVQTPIGIGEIEVIKELIVTWPLGQVQRFNNLEINHRYLIEEGKSEATKL